MRQTYEFIRDWIAYTPHFFREAPVSMWWDYFGSCHRVCCTLMLGREYLHE